MLLKFIYNEIERVGIMNVAIIVTELKEVKKESIVYYYEANELRINKDISGLLEFDLKLFEIDQDLEDVNKVVYEKTLTNEMKIIRKCMNCISLADDVDIVGIIALRDILSNYQLKEKIPSKTFYMSSELLIELLTDEKTSEQMKKFTHKTQEDVERLLKILRESQEEQ